ncbi:TadE/TadG family type IV pilus assembly protein [Marinimicrobium sp. C2-29]|uniref:TadE/TadG family type IV pilus assembly protein n=1 Tax=Marinimicrobium sp. C2-29 TaxID=3139825 RepID=UPI0031391F61
MLTSQPGKQKGAIIIMAVVSLLALFGMAALALDGGHLFLNKTRLQNAVDGAALSAAKVLDTTGDTVSAEVAALDTYTQFTGSSGNDELARGLDEMTFGVEFSDTLFPFVPGGVEPAFVRVTVTGVPLQPFFMGALGLTNKNVGASAVSGPSPALNNEVCNVVPMMLCGTDESDPETGLFYGYNTNHLHVLKTGAGDGSALGPGNFQLISLSDSTGGADLRVALAGGYDQCLSTSEPTPTETGNKVGPAVQGLNLRFGEASGPLDPELYKADYVIDHPEPGLTYSEDGQILDSSGSVVVDASDLAAAYPTDYSYEGYYSQKYEMEGASYDPTSGQYHRRVLTAPIGDCTENISGKHEVDTFGFGCVFLLQPMVQKGNEAQVFIEFLESCDAFGNFTMDSTAQGPTRIILYKNPDSNDS